MEEKETKVISFCNMKGGVGKSTLTTLLANYINNSTTREIFVADCDDGQESLADLRKIDLADDVKEEKLYDIEVIHPGDFPKAYTNYLFGNFDYILVDFPGTLMEKGVIRALTFVDYIFIPTGLGIKDLNSFKRFLKFYNENVLPIRKDEDLDTELYGIFNKVNTRTTEFEERDDIAEMLGVNFMKTYLPASDVTFDRKGGTIRNYSDPYGKQYISNFIQEIRKIIGF